MLLSKLHDMVSCLCASYKHVQYPRRASKLSLQDDIRGFCDANLALVNAQGQVREPSVSAKEVALMQTLLRECIPKLKGDDAQILGCLRGNCIVTTYCYAVLDS